MQACSDFAREYTGIINTNRRLIGSYDLKAGYNIVPIEGYRYVNRGEFVEVDGKHLGYEFQENQWSSDVNSVFYRYEEKIFDWYISTCYRQEIETYYHSYYRRYFSRNVTYSFYCYKYYTYTRWILQTQFGSEIFSGKSTRIKFRAFYTYYGGDSCTRSLFEMYSKAGTYMIEAKFSNYIKNFYSNLTIYERKNFKSIFFSISPLFF